MLWKTYGDCANYLELNGHKAAILDLHWSRDSRIVFSASADTLLASWDVEGGIRIRRYVGHEDVINVMDVARRGPEVMISGSDDGTIGVFESLAAPHPMPSLTNDKIWDPRQKDSVDYIETGFPVTALAMSEAGNEIFSGGIDNDIKVSLPCPSKVPPNGWADGLHRFGICAKRPYRTRYGATKTPSRLLVCHQTDSHSSPIPWTALSRPGISARLPQLAASTRKMIILFPRQTSSNCDADTKERRPELRRT